MGKASKETPVTEPCLALSHKPWLRRWRGCVPGIPPLNPAPSLFSLISVELPSMLLAAGSERCRRTSKPPDPPPRGTALRHPPEVRRATPLTHRGGTSPVPNPGTEGKLRHRGGGGERAGLRDTTHSPPHPPQIPVVTRVRWRGPPHPVRDPSPGGLLDHLGTKWSAPRAGHHRPQNAAYSTQNQGTACRRR